MMLKWMLVPLFIVISLNLIYGLDEGEIKIDNETKPTVISDNSTLNPVNSTSSSANVTSTPYIIATTKSTGKAETL